MLGRWRGQGDLGRAGRSAELCESLQIQAGVQRCGYMVDPSVQLIYFTGLNQAQMPFRQGKGLGAHQMSKYFDILPGQGLHQHIKVAWAADTVENYTGHCHPRIKIPEPGHQRGNRMGGFGGI